MGMARPLLLKRVTNDLRALSEMPGISIPDLGEDFDLPAAISVRVTGVRGYSAPGEEISEHSFDLYLGEDFPYERPRVIWRTRIFHPNIMPPSEGGAVCIAGRDRWDFYSSLSGFIGAVTDLIKNPNPHNPLVSETCSAAAEWFLKHV